MIVIDGTNGISFPDSTSQSTAPMQIGVGQTFQDVSASRVVGTTYTNSTGKPIMVAVTATHATLNPTLTVNSVVVANGSINTKVILVSIIPAGGTYSVTNGTTIWQWVELR